jgi:nitrite reductase/ring-hydroxylating ferredoxin subunit
VAAVARKAIKKMRARFPTANLLAYDNYNALAVGFAPTEKASEAIFSIALCPKYASLFFLQSGAVLKDPTRRLEGAGGQTRHIKLKSGDDLDDADVVVLMDEALTRAKTPFAKTGKGAIVIKSVSAKQRPRRAPAANRPK